MAPGLPLARGQIQRTRPPREFIRRFLFHHLRYCLQRPRAAPASKSSGNIPRTWGPHSTQNSAKFFPASIWQLTEMQELFSRSGWITVAFFQCQFDFDQLKPTRLLSNIAEVAALGFLGPPSFDSEAWYLGPLPKTCAHGGHPCPHQTFSVGYLPYRHRGVPPSHD